MKKCISILMSMVLILTFMLQAAANPNQEIKEMQEQKNSVLKELSDVQKRKQQAIADKEAIQKEINRLKGQVSQESSIYAELVQEEEEAERLLTEISEQLKLCEETLRKNQELYTTRLRILYESTRRHKLSILFQSKNLLSFFELLEGMQIMSIKDREMIETLKSNRQEVEMKLSMQEQLILDLESKVAQKKQRINSLNSSRSAKEADLEKKTGEIGYWDKKENELEQESKELEKEIKLLMSKLPYTGGIMQWPVPSAKDAGSRRFGMQMHPILKVNKMHTGIDIGAKSGAEIVAANDGKVIIAGWSEGYGNRLIIDHGGGISTLYAHCSKLIAKVGQKVKRGETIALIGSTGLSTGPHLHFEVREDGTPVDPFKKYLVK